MKSCIYPGSFDPFTLGHLDVIERSANIFDKVIVAVGENASKKYTFSLEDRLNSIKNNVKHIPKVSVVSFSGLLADFAYESGCKVVIKGVRNFQDFDYERLLHDIGLTQQRGIETLTIFSKSELSHVSSTAAKEICKNGGLLENYVPLSVKQELETTLNGQLILGVTGEIGMGKSYFSEKFCYVESIYGFDIKHIDLDKLAHDILHNRTERVYIDLRHSILKEFGLSIGNESIIDKKKLGQIVFNDRPSLKKLNDMMRIPIMTRIRKEIGNFKGCILLNGALLVEAGFLPICNNNIVVVKSSKEKQFYNLTQRGYSVEQIGNRINSQLNTDTKIKLIEESINKYGHGKLFEFTNYVGEEEFDQIDKIKRWIDCYLY